MTWTNSKAFAATQGATLDRSAATDYDGDSFKAALYNNTGTPSETVALSLTAYNTGQWVVANEVSHVGQWAVGGIVIANTDITIASNVVKFDGDDVASGAAATLSNVYGVLVYDDTITTPTADIGLSYNYLGGANGVTGGVFTVVWNAAGIVTWTV
jgi:hypothetical protein